jgi:hypothetical protein
MPDFDAILNDGLTKLDRGEPVDSILHDLPAEARELGALIRLAAMVREIPHPEPIAAQVTSQRKQVMAAAQIHTQPVRRPEGRIKNAWAWIGGAAVFAAAGAMTIMIVLLLAAFNFWQTARTMDTAQVESIYGQVQVATNRAGTGWKNLQPGDRLKQGQRLRTLENSAAVLIFFEGTRTVVTENVELNFVKLNAAQKSLQVEMVQSNGETRHKVTPLQGKKSFFLVRTPSGTASVQGTSFKVKVSENGQTKFAVSTGAVRVHQDKNEVVLLAGQTTSTVPGGDIADPSYQFGVQGSVLSIDEETGWWVVSGVEFQQTEETVVTGDPQLGNMVIVTGRILPDGLYVADSIAKTESDEQTVFFTGVLKSMIGSSWMIGETEVEVNADTEKQGELVEGTPVQVTANILEDGTWLALKIESLEEEPQEPLLPAPSATPDLSAKPSYEFKPDELQSFACDSREFNLTGTLTNTSNEIKDFAAGVELGYQVEKGGTYINSVELSPGRWERIDAGQTVSFNILVKLNESWAAAPDGSEAKLRVRVESATNRPDHLNGRLTVTLIAGCETKTTPTPEITETPDPEATITPTPTATAAPTVTPEVSPTPTTDGGSCTGASPHPTGVKLAQRYGVSYEEIMKWFCQYRLGFGEIDLGYSLSRSSGKPVEDVFAMRTSGMGWGAIKKELQGPNDKKPENPNNKKDKKDK